MNQCQFPAAIDLDDNLGASFLGLSLLSTGDLALEVRILALGALVGGLGIRPQAFQGMEIPLLKTENLCRVVLIGDQFLKSHNCDSDSETGKTIAPQ